MTASPTLPVLMYHSVGLEKWPWVWRHISISMELFEEHLTALKRAGYETLFLDCLEKGPDARSTGGRSVALTFDDGYLDNWTIAYPLLKKHNMRATVFVNPEFVVDEEGVRPTIEDVWSGRIPFEMVPRAGFLSWQELRAMQSSGVFDVQSHTMSHTWLFSGEKIVDFHRPGTTSQYPWVAWNERPERKHAYLSEAQDSLVPWGRPIYMHSRALAAREYIEDEALRCHLQDLVANAGGARFFGDDGPGIAELHRRAEQYRLKFGELGRFEDDREYATRVRRELALSRTLLESRLGKPVRYLCWPGGALTARAVELAVEAGYVAATLPSGSGASGLPSLPGLIWIPRIGAQSRLVFRGNDLGPAPPSRLVRAVAIRGGSRVAAALGKGSWHLETLLGLWRRGFAASTRRSL